MSENSSYDKLINNNEPVRFFYGLKNAVYFIECQESRLGVNEYSDKNDPLNFIFPCEHLNTKKKYRLSCKKLSTTFVTQALNNIIFNINLNPIEQQKREFSENDKKCLESHLKNDLPKWLTNYKPNDFMYRAFFELYTSYESAIRQNNDYNNSNCQVTLPSNSQYEYAAVEETFDETFNYFLQNNSSFLQYYQNNGSLDICTEESQLLASVNEIGNIHQNYDDDYNKASDKNNDETFAEKSPPSERTVESSTESESSAGETKSRPCNWSEDATKCLSSCLKKRSKSLKKHGGIKWAEVSEELRSCGFIFSPQKCSNKWKNMKQNKNKKYKLQVNEILGTKKKIKIKKEGN